MRESSEDSQDRNLAPFVSVVGPSRAKWLWTLVRQVVPGARLLILGSRRSGKTTVLASLPGLLGSPGTTSIHCIEAFSATPKALEQLAVHCSAPRHQSQHRIVLIDDVECFSGSDITAIRRHMRGHNDITFVLTTSTVAGLQESLAAQCTVLQLSMPRLADLERLGGPECVPVAGMSIGSACNQKRACELVGRKVRWRERCEAPAIVATVGAANSGPGSEGLLSAALLEVDRLFLNGWSCGDIIETLHLALVQGTWPPSLERHIVTVLLKHSTYADRPDLSSAMAYLMVIELAAVTTATTTTV
jgi:energy-coupling factor transporter ATP-binding protein EcfA2